MADASREYATPVPGRRSFAGRLAAFVLLVCCCAILGMAAWLKPDPRGFGTHEQLAFGKTHLAPCGMLAATGFPCPTCGMTTAFAHTVRGQWLQAIWAQPSGFLLALATAATAAMSAWALVTGSNPLWQYLPFVTPYRLFLGLTIVLFGGWFFRVAITYANRISG
ncbi:MAG: DUF2752 domain-containing protein [Planctomycetes bacterium]|nr:DUF2752 domain-containing protein [Planctomycetota bacterium]